MNGRNSGRGGIGLQGALVGAVAAGLLAGVAGGQTTQGTPPKASEKAAPGNGVAPTVPTAPAAAPPPAQPGNGPAGPPQASDVRLDIWTEARAVLEKELATVKGLSSVRGEAKSDWEHAIEGQPPFRQELSLRYALAKPNKVYLANKDMEVFADGTMLTVYAKPLKQYVQAPMPDLRDLRETIERMSGGQFRSIPGEAMLRPGMSLEQTLRGVTSVQRARNEEIMGRTGTWVTGTAIDDRQPLSIAYSFERWYADDDSLVRFVKTDMTGMYQDMVDRIAAEESLTSGTPTKSVRYIHVGMTTNYTRELNPALGPEVFAYAPGADDHKVESFVWLTMPGVREQIAMLGKPAPAMVGMDFGSVTVKADKTVEVGPARPVDVSSFKGKVVVLDFWATWCGPCCASLPAMQMVALKYADKPFQMIGVNREHAGDEHKVLPFLVHRNLGIAQFNDADQKAPDTRDAYGNPVPGAIIQGKAARAYHTENSIPCVVLIDQQGNVADIETGYLPGKENELMAKIDKLLAGQPVHTPEEIRALNELAAGWKGN